MCPTYDFFCPSCEKQEEVFMKIADFKEPECCGNKMRQRYGHNVIGELHRYLDPNLGDKPVWVESKKHRKELMKKAGVIENYGKGWV